MEGLLLCSLVLTSQRSLQPVSVNSAVVGPVLKTKQALHPPEIQQRAD